MLHYEYCHIRNRRIGDGEQQRYAVKLTPSGVTEFKEGPIGPAEGNRKTERMWNDFVNDLVAEGWTQLANGKLTDQYPSEEIFWLTRPAPDSSPVEANEYCRIYTELAVTGQTGYFFKKKTVAEKAIVSRVTPLGLVQISGSMESLQSSIDRLTIDGWHLIAGEDNLMSRPIGSDHRIEPEDSSKAEDHIEKLKRLAELRESGVLTDDEFQKKKSEILDRI